MYTNQENKWRTKGVVNMQFESSFDPILIDDEFPFKERWAECGTYNRSVKTWPIAPLVVIFGVLAALGAVVTLILVFK